MAESGGVEYVCECGKKWKFTAKELVGNSTLECTCGRNLVVKNGFVFSTGRQRQRQSRKRPPDMARGAERQMLRAEAKSLN
jgi:hypothetical protein